MSLQCKKISDNIWKIEIVKYIYIYIQFYVLTISEIHFSWSEIL